VADLYSAIGKSTLTRGYVPNKKLRGKTRNRKENMNIRPLLKSIQQIHVLPTLVTAVVIFFTAVSVVGVFETNALGFLVASTQEFLVALSLGTMPLAKFIANSGFYKAILSVVVLIFMMCTWHLLWRRPKQKS